jgi:hypothetical protein
MAQTHPQTSNREREIRQEHVDNAIASVRMENLEPTELAKTIFARYIAGDISVKEMSSEIRALNAREFGPIPVPGD